MPSPGVLRGLPIILVLRIYEIKKTLVFAEEFAGQYTKSVTLSDGRTRAVELTPMIRNGARVIEFKDHRSYMGMVRVRTGAHTTAKLMVQIQDLDELDAA